MYINTEVTGQGPIAVGNKYNIIIIKHELN
jgi:hypothetical protein